MTTKQIASQPISFIQLIGILIPIVIIVISWGVSISVRVKALEIQFDNMNEKSGKMENTLSAINDNLSDIKLSINTLTVKFEEDEKKNNRKLENNPNRL